MSTLPIPPLTALPPSSNAANTALRWTATRHHESLQTFLRTNSTLVQEMEELKRSQSQSTLTEDDVSSRVAVVREEMQKTINGLTAQLDSQSDQLSRQQGELDAKDLKIAQLEDSGASSSAALTAEIEGLKEKVTKLEAENSSLSSDKGNLESHVERFRILNEELELENQRLNESNAVKQTTIKGLQKTLHDFKTESQKSGTELADVEKRWKRAMEDMERSLTGDNKRRVNQMEEEMMFLRTELENTKESNAAAERKVEKEKLLLVKEREGRESAQRQFKITIDALQKDLDDVEASKTEEIERLNVIIVELRDEIARLEGQPKEVAVPDGSKFQMYVDLKTKNAKLAKQLKKEKDRTLIGGTAGGGLRRASRARPEVGGSSAAPKMSSGTTVGRSGVGKRPEEVYR